MTFSIDQVMQFGWKPVLSHEDIDGDSVVALRVPPIADFVVYGETEDEVRADWESALRSHLKGYMAVGKAIPRPTGYTVSSSGAAVITEGVKAWSQVTVRNREMTDLVSYPAEEVQPA